MKFIEAYELLKEGKCVGRTEWEARNDGQFMFIYEQVEFPMVMKIVPQPNVMNFQPRMCDLEANDWFVKEVTWNKVREVTVAEPVEFEDSGDVTVQ